MVDAQLKWDRNPVGTLSDLRSAIRRRIVRKAVRQASMPIRRELKSSSPKRTGSLRVAIGNKIYAKKFTVGSVTGAKLGFGRVYKGVTIRPQKYAKAVEKRRPYLAPALERNKTVFLQILARVIGEEIEKELNKGTK